MATPYQMGVTWPDVGADAKSTSPKQQSSMWQGLPVSLTKPLPFTSTGPTSWPSSPACLAYPASSAKTIHLTRPQGQHRPTGPRRTLNARARRYGYLCLWLFAVLLTAVFC